MIDVHHAENTTDGCSYDIEWYVWVGYYVFQFIVLEINQNVLKELDKSLTLKGTQNLGCHHEFSFASVAVF